MVFSVQNRAMSTDPADRSRRRRSRYLAAPPKPPGNEDVAEPPLTYDPASMRARMRAGLKRPGGKAPAEDG